MNDWIGGLMIKAVSDYAVSVAALLIALGAIYRYAIRPFRNTVKEMSAGIHWVQAQMERNGGSSLMDHVVSLEADVAELKRTKDDTQRMVAEIRARIEAL